MISLQKCYSNSLYQSERIRDIVKINFSHSFLKLGFFRRICRVAGVSQKHKVWQTSLVKLWSDCRVFGIVSIVLPPATSPWPGQTFGVGMWLATCSNRFACFQIYLSDIKKLLKYRAIFSAFNKCLFTDKEVLCYERVCFHSELFHLKRSSKMWFLAMGAF